MNRLEALKKGELPLAEPIQGTLLHGENSQPPSPCRNQGAVHWLGVQGEGE